MEFVISWTKPSNQDLSLDQRGWKKDKPRKYTDQQEEKILSIYYHLKDDPSSFFCGASAILNLWKDYYPFTLPPHLRYIGRVLKKHKLTEKIKRGKNKGASRYLLYPDYTILNHISQDSLLEIDFIGKKFIKGRSKPLNFLAFSLRGKHPLKHFIRVEEYNQEEVMTQLEEFMTKFEKPYAVKMDNDFVFFGPSSKEGFLSKVVLFLLLHNIIPIFTAPRKPWNQASIEGANSVFSRKFWNRCHFESVSEIDRQLSDFNLSYQGYLNYQRPDSFKENKNFSYSIYLIRKIYQEPESTKGYIQIGSKRIILDPAYINLFTLSKWDLEKEILYIYIQRETQFDSKLPSFYLQLVKEIPFEINKTSDKKVVDFYLSYNLYQVKNLANGKIFIDSGQNIQGKINSCQFQLSNGSYMNKALQEDFNKMGFDNFTFEIIDLLEPKEDTKMDYTDDLKMLEEIWIDKLQPFDERGYNKRKIIK